MHLQVDNIFKISRKHTIAKVAHHNLSPTEQAPKNNISGRKHVQYTLEGAMRAFFCHDDPGVHQAVHCHPFLNLVITFNWFQDSSDLMFFTPCQTWFLPHLQLHDPSLNFTRVGKFKNALAIFAGRYVLALIEIMWRRK